MNLLKINDKKLKDQIDGFKALYNKDPYIICSEKTFDKLTEGIEDIFKPFKISDEIVLTIDNIEVKKNGKKDYNEAMYYACRVLINNDLTFGDIEVR